MLKMILQPAFPSMDLIAEVDRTLEGNLVRLKKPNDPGRIKTAVLDPSFAEHGFEPDAISHFRTRGVGGNSQKFIAQFKRGYFIRVGVVNPGIPEWQPQGSRAMLFFVIEGSLNDARARSPCDFHGVVRAERIENNDVVAPFHGLQTGGKIGLLVQG